MLELIENIRVFKGFQTCLLKRSPGLLRQQVDQQV